MANKHTLCLSADGLITNSVRRADIVLSRFLTSEYTQNAMVENKFSFPYLLAVHKENDDALEAEVVQIMQYTLKEHFNSAIVSCEVKQHPENEAWRAVYIRMSLVDIDGHAFDINHLVTADNSKFINYVKINNGTLPFTSNQN